jgi:hypothetical protein
MTEITSIETVDSKSFRNAILPNIKNLIFRRVSYVSLRPEDKLQTVNFEDDQHYSIYSSGTEPVFNECEMLHNVEEKYSKFHFNTSSLKMRDNDIYNGISIFGHSSKYSVLDITDTCSFRFSYDRTDRTNHVPPRKGDLICGLVLFNEKLQSASFRFWFVCSEQFLRAWTAIMYEKHEALSKKGDSEERIRQVLMSGNRLATNSFRKWIKALEQTPKTPENNHFWDNYEAEKKEKYYRLRTETISRDYVHIYACLVLIIRYGELPCKYNIPVNYGNNPNMTEWDLPQGWLDKIMKRYSVIKTGTKIVEIQKNERQNEEIKELIQTEEKISRQFMAEGSVMPLGADFESQLSEQNPIIEETIVYKPHFDMEFPPLK